MESELAIGCIQKMSLIMCRGKLLSLGCVVATCQIMHKQGGGAEMCMATVFTC